MRWLISFLRWLFGRRQVAAVNPEPVAREHNRTRLHRGWHRDPGRPPWHKARKARSV